MKNKSRGLNCQIVKIAICESSMSQELSIRKQGSKSYTYVNDMILFENSVTQFKNNLSVFLMSKEPIKKNC